jgi:hypothetical protein
MRQLPHVCLVERQLPPSYGAANNAQLRCNVVHYPVTDRGRYTFSVTSKLTSSGSGDRPITCAASCMSSRTVFTLCASRTFNTFATISIIQEICISDVRCAWSMCVQATGHCLCKHHSPSTSTHTRKELTCASLYISNLTVTLLHSPFVLFRTRTKPRQSTKRAHLLNAFARRRRLPNSPVTRLGERTLCRSKEHSRTKTNKHQLACDRASEHGNAMTKCTIHHIPQGQEPCCSDSTRLSTDFLCLVADPPWFGESTSMVLCTYADTALDGHIAAIMVLLRVYPVLSHQAPSQPSEHDYPTLRYYFPHISFTKSIPILDNREKSGSVDHPCWIPPACHQSPTAT